MLKEYIDELIQKGVKNVVIDVDNTITKSNVLELYLFIKSTSYKNKYRYYLWLIIFVISTVPFYVILDFINRDWFQRVFYRNYCNYSLKELEFYAKELFEKKLRGKFIKEIHDFIFYLKNKNVNVELLSTSIEPIVKQYGYYFGVPFESIKIIETNNKLVINYSSIKDFKLNHIKKYDKRDTIAIADSKHDLQILNYADNAVVVCSKAKGWFKKLNKNPLIVKSTIN